jgi:hypothetical protein
MGIPNIDGFQMLNLNSAGGSGAKTGGDYGRSVQTKKLKVELINNNSLEGRREADLVHLQSKTVGSSPNFRPSPIRLEFYPVNQYIKEG